MQDWLIFFFLMKILCRKAKSMTFIKDTLVLTLPVTAFSVVASSVCVLDEVNKVSE